MDSKEVEKMGKQQINAKIRMLAICCAVLFLSSIATNESWGAEKKFPNRVINVVVAYAPGSTDVYTRPHLEKMAEYLGQPMSFVYKPGAAGTLGSSYATKAKPDGYTLIAANQGPVLLGPVTKEGIDYTYDSFVPICQMVSVPMFMAVKTESPMKTLDDVIAAAKASPGKLTFSTSGVFSTPHLGMEIFQKSAGIKLTHVPTAGSAPAVTALLGDHVAMTASGIGPLKPNADAGTLRLIALMEEKRLKTYPNIPTFLELGYRVIFPNWYGLLAPKGTPKEIIDTIFDTAKKANDLNRDSIEKQCKQLGIEISFLNPDEFDKSNREQLKTIISIFKDIQGK
jgi:tripartite-type tricarboxylate transporter receptor subunit TctC